MTVHELNATCPHCGTDTGIHRGEAAELPARLSLEEFEALVRSEWRRRLGPRSYTRTHDTTIITTLARLALEPGAVNLEADLARAVVRLLAELRAEGTGRGAFRHEAAKLVHAMRKVLRTAGADAGATAVFVGSARDALERALGLPRGPTGATEFELSRRRDPL